MKTRKRLLSVILCLVLFASLLPVAFAAATVTVNGVAPDADGTAVPGVKFDGSKLTVGPGFTVADKAEGVGFLIEVTGGDIEVDLKQELDITGKTYDGVISSTGKITFVNSASQNLKSDAKGIVAGEVALTAAKLSVTAKDNAAIDADKVNVDEDSELTAAAAKANASVDISAITAGAVTSAGKLTANGGDYGITLKDVTGIDKACAVNDGSFVGTGSKGVFKEAFGITVDSTKLAVKAGNDAASAVLKNAGDASTFYNQKYVEIVPYVPVTGISLNKPSTTIAAGADETLTVTITPENATNKEVEWSSNNTAAATVDSTGKVTGVAVGTASITAQSKDNPGKFATCTVTVAASVIHVDDVEITGPSTVKVNEEKALQVTITPANATNQKLYYSSSDDTVLIAASDGKILGRKAGKATVTVTSDDGSHTDTYEITVTADTDITAIRINGATHTLSGKGTFTSLNAVLTPTNPTNSAVNWTSSDNTICTVTQSTTNQLQATVKAVKNGECTITCASAKDPTVKDTWKITVTNAEADPYKITNTSTPTWYYDNKNTNKDVTITANGPASLFTGLKIGSLTVPANTGYTLAQDTSGNTVLTVKDSWLQNNVPKTRSNLTLELTYSNGGKATGNFHVLSVSDTPFTGDSDVTFAYVLLLASGLGIVWCGLHYGRRKRTEH